MKKLYILLILLGNLCSAFAQESIVISKQDGSTTKYALNDEIDSIICTPQKQTLVWNRKKIATITKVAPSALMDSLTISQVGAVSATLLDHISLSTSSTFTNAGYCYSYENASPTINDEHISTGLLSFRKYNLKGLKSDKTYYIRGYSKSGDAYAYGPISSLKTAPYAQIQMGLTEHFWTKANFYNNFFATNDIAVSESGICYATHPSPTTSDFTTKSKSLMNLTPSTVYYARAFVKVNQNAQYGPEIAFKTRALEDSVIIEAENSKYLVYSNNLFTLKKDTITQKGLSGDTYITISPFVLTQRSDLTFSNVPVHLGTKYKVSIAIVPKTIGNTDSTQILPNKFMASLTYLNANGIEINYTLRGVGTPVSFFTNDVTKINEVLLGEITFPAINDLIQGTLSDGTIKLKIQSLVTPKEINSRTFDNVLRIDYMKLKVATE